jgi:hypothetical protein
MAPTKAPTIKKSSTRVYALNSQQDELDETLFSVELVVGSFLMCLALALLPVNYSWSVKRWLVPDFVKQKDSWKPALLLHISTALIILTGMALVYMSIDYTTTYCLPILGTNGTAHRRRLGGGGSSTIEVNREDMCTNIYVYDGFDPDNNQTKVKSPGRGTINHCCDPKSFLGVANVFCLQSNRYTAGAIVGLFVILSVFFEHFTHKLRHSTHNPQMLKIIDHLLTEVMILGFISMSFFFLFVQDVTGWMARVDKAFFKGDEDNCQNSSYDQFHLMEFFHYAIFVTMCLYVFAVFLLVIGASLIPLMWRKSETRARSHSRAQRGVGDMDSADMDSSSEISKEDVTLRYAELKLIRREKGWSEKIKPRHWWNWWLFVNRMGYKLARQSSKVIYTNPELFSLAFEVPKDFDDEMTYPKYFIFCTRATLIHIMEVSPSSWLFLFAIVIGNFVGDELFPGRVTEDLSAGTSSTDAAHRFLNAGLYSGASGDLGWDGANGVANGVGMHRQQSFDGPFADYASSNLYHTDHHHHHHHSRRLGSGAANCKNNYDPVMNDDEKASYVGFFVGGGFVMVFMFMIISMKTFKILMGIVNDRIEIAQDGDATVLGKGESAHLANTSYAKVAEETTNPLAGAARKPTTTTTTEQRSGSMVFTNNAMVDRKHASHQSAYLDGSPSAGAEASVGVDLPAKEGEVKSMKGERASASLAVDGEGLFSENKELAMKKYASMAEYHKRRFWFKKPELLLQMVQVLFFLQSIYLAIVLLMFTKGYLHIWGGFGVVAMFLPWVINLFFLLPITLAPLVLVLDLTGYIGGHSLEHIEHGKNHGHGGGHGGHGHGHGERRRVQSCPFCGTARNIAGEQTPGVWQCMKCGVSCIPTHVLCNVLDDHDLHSTTGDRHPEVNVDENGHESIQLDELFTGGAAKGKKGKTGKKGSGIEMGDIKGGI